MGLFRGPRVLWTALAAGLGLRLGLLLWYLATHGWQGEVWDVEGVALNLLEGRGFLIEFLGVPVRSYCMPLFPLLCAFLHRVGGPGLWAFYAFQFAASVGIILLTFLLVRRWLGERTGLLAAWMAALEPGLIVYQSYKVDEHAVAVLCVLGALYGLSRMKESPGIGPALATGAVMGAGMLTRPDLVVLCGACLLWMVLERGKPWVIRQGLAALACSGLVLAPWAARNYRVHGRLMPFTSTAYYHLWAGNNPASLGTLISADGRAVLDAAPEDLRARLAAADELGQGEVFREAAAAHIRAAPGQFALRAVKRAGYFWWFSPTFGVHYEWASRWMFAAYRILHLLILGAAVFGLLLVFGREGAGVRRETLAVLAVPACLCFIHAVFYVETRHRMLVMPLLLALAAHGAAGGASAPRTLLEKTRPAA